MHNLVETRALVLGGDGEQLGRAGVEQGPRLAPRQRGVHVSRAQRPLERALDLLLSLRFLLLLFFAPRLGLKNCRFGELYIVFLRGARW